jgi:hypothetical protein
LLRPPPHVTSVAIHPSYYRSIYYFCCLFFYRLYMFLNVFRFLFEKLKKKKQKHTKDFDGSN